MCVVDSSGTIINIQDYIEKINNIFIIGMNNNTGIIYTEYLNNNLYKNTGHQVINKK